MPVFFRNSNFKCGVFENTGSFFEIFGSLSIVGVGFVKIPPQFYEKGSFYVWFQVLLILGMPNKPPHYRPFYPMMYSGVSGFGTV